MWKVLSKKTKIRQKCSIKRGKMRNTRKNVGNQKWVRNVEQSFSEGNSPALIRRYESTCHQVVYSEGGKQKQT